MSIATIEVELEAFREFALKLGQHDKTLTLRDAWDIWQNRDSDLQAALAAIEDMRKGDVGKPHVEVMEMLRARTYSIYSDN